MTADPFNLAGQVAVVTAGLEGLGLEIAELLADMGAQVIVTTRDAEKAQAFDGGGRTIEARPLTFEPESVNRFVGDIAGSCGSLNVLVNCAAGRTPGLAVEDTGTDDLLEAINASLGTSFLCARAAVARRDETNVTSIVNLGSVYGSLAVDHRIYEDPGRQTPLAYACAKGALVQMTRYLAAYWAPLGVRVNCVSPGGVRRGQTKEFLERYSARVPMGRMADASEVASAAAFLAAPASGYITGENLMVDGGLHVW